MATLQKPKKKKGKPPVENTSSNNLDTLSGSELVPLNFKTDPEFKKQFKLTATEKGMSMVDYLKELYYSDINK